MDNSNTVTQNKYCISGPVSLNSQVQRSRNYICMHARARARWTHRTCTQAALSLWTPCFVLRTLNLKSECERLYTHAASCAITIYRRQLSYRRHMQRNGSKFCIWSCAENTYRPEQVLTKHVATSAFENWGKSLLISSKEKFHSRLHQPIKQRTLRAMWLSQRRVYCYTTVQLKPCLSNKHGVWKCLNQLQYQPPWV